MENSTVAPAWFAPAMKDILKDYPNKEDLAHALSGYATKEDLKVAMSNHPTKNDLLNALTEMTTYLVQALTIKPDFDDLEKRVVELEDRVSS